MSHHEIGFKRTLFVSLLGCLATAVLVMVFRYLIEIEFFVNNSSNLWLYFSSPFIGALLLIVLFKFFNKYSKSGLPMVVMGFHFGDGKMGLGNLIFQFVGATISLMFGFAVGAVGPALHIGAACSNVIGQHFLLDASRLRQLTACGAAAAMAALFHTPITAIFFAQETIVRRFQLQTFILMSLSAVVAAWIARQMGVYEFHIESHSFSYQLTLVPELILLGIICGVLASFLLKMVRLTADRLPFPYWGKFILAASATALAAVAGDEVIGIGNHLLEKMLYGEFTSTLILLWLVARFFISAIAIGSAIPGGALGPSLLLGALTGHLVSLWLPNEAPQVFVLVGMSAFFGAVLKSPIAATLMVVETTADLNLAFPCLIGAGVASYVQHKLMSERNLIELLLARQNILIKNSPTLANIKQKKMLD
ncbi:chloride channel protein [Motilimonas pumila]|uniref:Chloride channel protein n=1 Tax=Motilimonas pumila TaxID=2303987 RepID=A0A418YAM5_9GAMM|nr:chloride channel protein [Motilimonas pumila]RJG40009.1 chloride channel protein [Motilimonas pumila]